MEEHQVNGILVLDKPAGFTSHDCVAQVRKFAGIKKVGHTGTLDPAVTGVLPICLGQATRVAQYLLDFQKEYIAEISLGRSTTTQDHEGETDEKSPLKEAPTEEQIKNSLRLFRGKIKQIPPMYSAVRHNGVRLHQLAREGKVVERKAREVEIYDLQLVDYQPSVPYPTMKLRVLCSKGTYMRTLGVDIGHTLGYPAHLASLIRSKSGPFTLQESVSFDQIRQWKEEDWLTKLYPPDSVLTHFPKLMLDDALIKRVKYGQSLALNEKVKQDQIYRIYDRQEQFIALYQGFHPHVIKPKKVFLP